MLSPFLISHYAMKTCGVSGNIGRRILILRTWVTCFAPRFFNTGGGEVVATEQETVSPQMCFHHKLPHVKKSQHLHRLQNWLHSNPFAKKFYTTFQPSRVQWFPYTNRRHGAVRERHTVRSPWELPASPRWRRLIPVLLHNLQIPGCLNG